MTIVVVIRFIFIRILIIFIIIVSITNGDGAVAEPMNARSNSYANHVVACSVVSSESKARYVAPDAAARDTSSTNKKMKQQ